jgi:hypothetical protein
MAPARKEHFIKYPVLLLLLGTIGVEECVYIQSDMGFNLKIGIDDDLELTWFELYLPKTQVVLVDVCCRRKNYKV